MTRLLDSIKTSLQQGSDKGALLELVICDLLEDNGFSNIHRQQSGSQYGFDVVATKESAHDSKPEVWKFECKNLNSPISIAHIAPKLIWHLSSTILDRFIIISVSPLSNDLHQLLEQRTLPMAIEVWEGDTLLKKIYQSPKALKRLGLSSIAKGKKITISTATPREFLPKEVTLDVIHDLNPPYSFDYFFIDGKLVKAYNDIGFILNGIIANHHKRSDFFINDMSVVTNSFSQIEGRVLRQYKLKGFYSPTKFKFKPSIVPGGQTRLLTDQKYKVSAFYGRRNVI